MSPTIAYAPDGSVRIAVGAAGGPTIIAQVAKVLIGVIDWKLSAQDALALPNFYLRGDRLLVEQGTYWRRWCRNCEGAAATSPRRQSAASSTRSSG
jgi:gamma-glutamyltranspeptidase